MTANIALAERRGGKNAYANTKHFDTLTFPDFIGLIIDFVVNIIN